MNTSRKIEIGLKSLLHDCGLRGWIAAKSDQDTVTQGYPQTIVSVSDKQAGGTHPSEYIREATVDVQYVADGEAQVDIDDDLTIIADALSDQDALRGVFNYPIPYSSLTDTRPVQGIHFNQTTDLQSTIETEGNQIQVNFTASLAIQRVINHP